MQRSYGRDQCDRAVGATIGPELGHRLDEANVHTPPVEGPHQTEASPSQANAGRSRDDQQGPGHNSSYGAGESPSTARDDAGGVAGDQELFVRRYDQRQDRTGEADSPASVPAVVGIRSNVLGQPEEAQPAEHQATDDGAVFPDAAGEDQCVEPLEPDHQPGDRLG